MGWLNSWLKEIILIILLATFVDLILPNNSLQRYVKVVIGLLILLTLLSPIISLLNINMDPDKAELTLALMENRQSSDPLFRGRGRMKSLADIEKEAELIKTANEQQSLRFVENRVAEMVKASIEESTGKPVLSVDVVTSLDEQSKPRIASMQIVLQQERTAAGDQAKDIPADQSKLIQPIEPVSIQIEIGPSDNPKDRGKPKALSEEMQASKKQVSELIAKEWQIASPELKVVYDVELGH